MCESAPPSLHEVQTSCTPTMLSCGDTVCDSAPPSLHEVHISWAPAVLFCGDVAASVWGEPCVQVKLWEFVYATPSTTKECPAGLACTTTLIVLVKGEVRKLK